MTTELLQNSTLRIEAYSFAEFLQEYQEAVLNGYFLDVETNEHYPIKYGDYLTVTLISNQWRLAEVDTSVDPDFIEVKEDVPVIDKPAVTTAVKAGRPRKS